MSQATQELFIASGVLIAVGVFVYLAARQMGKSRRAAELRSLRRPNEQKAKHSFASHLPAYILAASIASVMLGAQDVALGQSPEKILCGIAGIAYLLLWRRGTSDGVRSANIASIERGARVMT